VIVSIFNQADEIADGEMDKIKKISITKSFSQWLLASCVMAGLSVSVTAEEVGPVEMLQALTEQLIEISNSRPEILDDPVELRIVANEVVLPHIDFVLFSRRVLGKNWRKATTTQQADFVREFRELLLGTYVRSMSAYKGNTIRFLPLRKNEQGNRVEVNALVVQKNGPEVHVSFRLHRVADEWLIYDFLVEGISLVATHRSTFSQEIHNHGIDNVIEQLRLKNESNTGQQAAGEG
jgi:phospholipid transport system substrate-binding protein